MRRAMQARCFGGGLLLLVVGCRDDATPHDPSAQTGETSDDESSGGTGTTGERDTTDGGPDDSSSDTGAPPSLGDSATTLPFEVIGICRELGTVCATVTTHVDVSESLAQSSARLRLTIHNIVAPDSADLQINGGEPRSLAVLGQQPLRRRGGVSTVEIELPAGALRPGANTFTFSYRPMTDGVSGYRVLDLVLDVDGTPLRPELDAVDPDSWRGFDERAAAVERGREYFTEISRDGGPTCGACHVDSGADFEYFALSNDSIVKRAMFHEFSEADAEDIASFVRAAGVERLGRTFDPPFQPGAANRGAAGAGWDQAVDDDTFGAAVFGDDGTATERAWDFAAGIDLYTLPAPVQVPSWFRWMPRELEDSWLAMETTFGGEPTTVGAAADALLATPSYASAWRLNSAAFSVSRALRSMGEHRASIEVTRFAAVKLWAWSRGQDFEAEHHGFPDVVDDALPTFAPPYPYEVGFAFFETAQDGGQGVAEPWQQAIDWWWVQLAVHPGRGLSSAQRPVNYHDVLIAAREAGLGPNALTFVHLLGSYEESVSPQLADAFGTAQGSLRHLEIPLASLDTAGRIALWKRFVRQQSLWLDSAPDAALSVDHLALLADVWEATSAQMTDAQRDEIRALARDAALPSLGG